MTFCSIRGCDSEPDVIKGELQLCLDHYEKFLLAIQRSGSINNLLVDLREAKVWKEDQKRRKLIAEAGIGPAGEFL